MSMPRAAMSVATMKSSSAAFTRSSVRSRAFCGMSPLSASQRQPKRLR